MQLERYLRFQSNGLVLESCALNRRTHSVSLQTSTILRDIAHLIHRITEAAWLSQKTAQAMIRTTRVSVEVRCQLKSHKPSPLMYTGLGFYDTHSHSPPVL
jgi:hypothetical protein